MSFKTLFTIVLLVLAVSGCTANQVNQSQDQNQNQATAEAELNQVDSESTDQIIELRATASGQTAEELLTANHQVEFEDFGDAGKFVSSIDGLESNDQNYWAFYVNDDYAQAGVTQTILVSGDTIKFVYEEIQP